jgi:uncharacterized protein YhaN
MTRDSIRFEEIQVIRAPGFETGGFSVEDLSSDINVVHGPNAAGKTTLAESLEWLCWPAAANERASLVGHFSVDEEAWRVDLNNGRPSYQREGQQANAPSLPPADQRDRYRLSLHDLLQQDNTNESFAKIIERESAGGYDLSAAYDELGYSDTPSRSNKNVVQDAERAVQDLREARNEVTELRQKQNQLSRLRSEFEDARQANQRVELLEQAIVYAEAKNTLENAQSALAEYPEKLDRVDGNEIDQVRELEAGIEEWVDKKETAEATKTEAKTRLAEVELPDGSVPTGRIDHLKSLRDDLNSAEDRKQELKTELAEAERQRETAREDIPLEVETEDLVELEPVTWKTVSKFAREAEELQATRETRAAVQRLLDIGENPEGTLSTLERGSQSLEQWLAAGATDGTGDGSEAFKIAAVSAVSLALAGIALGLLVNPLLLSILAVAVGILWYGLRVRSQATAADTDSRTPHHESFEQTSLDSPGAWTDEAVRSRLIELYDAIADHKIANQRSEWRESLATDSDSLEEAEVELEQTRANLKAQLGAAPDVSDVELTVLTKRVLDWQEAHDEVEGIQASLDSVDEQIETARGDLQAELTLYGYDTVKTSGQSIEAIRDLETREANRQTAQRNLEQAEATIEEATGKTEGLEEEREQIFAQFDLDVADHGTLKELCEQVEEYEAATEAVREAEIRAEGEADKLEGYPEFEPDLKDEAVADLREVRNQAERIAEGFEELQSRIADIEAEIRQAKNDDEIETALAERGRALEGLRDQLEDDYSAMVGDVLVDHVQEATMDSGRPEVFERAREILSTITRGRYRLDFDKHRAAFRAYDETKQKGLALDELSSGTRIQILLAVRLAFVEQQEQGVRVPLLLDETLANSDDRRAKTIIESAVEIARNGRQVFYFTAQGDEVAKWTAILEDTADVDHEVVDLAGVRELEQSVHIPDLSTVESLTPSVPSSDGVDHRVYRNLLDVDSFNPHHGVGTAHLWYVVDDVDTLHDLLELGITYWGQLENLLRWGNGGLQTVGDDQLRVARENAAALEEFADAWKVGRGKPVDREVLDASGAVSGNFIDEVSELAGSLNGNGREIVETLHDSQVKGFRTGKASELETYLEENGFIESREPLDDGHLRARAIERYADEGVPSEKAKDRTEEVLSRVGDR